MIRPSCWATRITHLLRIKPAIPAVKMAPPAPHEGTPFLLPTASMHTPSYLVSGSASDSPSSSISSSSSRTVVGPSSSRTQLGDPALLRAPSAQEVHGRTPPPAYASLSTTAPPSPWGATEGESREEASTPPAFTMFATPHQFGPTPLRRAATVPYAVYIDAPGAPDARAWRRFVGALGLALALFILASLGLALEFVGEIGWLHGRVVMRGRAREK